MQGNGSGLRGMGRKPANAFGHLSESQSQGGATRKAPATRSVRSRDAHAAQCATARHPRLCATKKTGRGAHCTCLSSLVDQSARMGSAQLCCSTRRNREYFCSHRVCQWSGPELFQPGTVKTENRSNAFSMAPQLSNPPVTTPAGPLQRSSRLNAMQWCESLRATSA